MKQVFSDAQCPYSGGLHSGFYGISLMQFSISSYHLFFISHLCSFSIFYSLYRKYILRFLPNNSCLIYSSRASQGWNLLVFQQKIHRIATKDERSNYPGNQVVLSRALRPYPSSQCIMPISLYYNNTFCHHPF